ncbi:LysR family transcriptional regulator [Salinisphaera sp.]|uniref:LysR family transcriptional regulator n=1 Tax=Salinisphaera sp. TaxID=1914330 RepID=UPI000C36B2C2|nr:LysR family transcriptional regulator [Salinisphaera sp.]MAS11250.1 LysR family transcriptional regulator [Salinisphaera sp.]|tara:strand:+ start:2722 stop:3633 length:912 start_codon:yes stop_codon:yes gene_type:complete
MDALRDLEFFGVLCRAGSLSAAARELDVTPAATSKRLAAIEQRLGVQLLNRNTRSMSLSAEGELYLREGRAIVGRVAELENRLKPGEDTVRGALRINASLGFGRKYIAALVSAFVQRHPLVTVDMDLSDHPLDLVERSYDVGIRFGALPDSTLHARRIAPHRRLLCAAPGYLERAGTPRHPVDLADHNCLILRQNEEAYGIWRFQRGREQLSVKVQGNLSANDGESVVAWALDGHGIIQRAAWEVDAYIARGALVEILPEYALPQADISAVYHYQQFVPPKVRAFIDFFAEYVADTALPTGGA